MEKSLKISPVPSVDKALLSNDTACLPTLQAFFLEIRQEDL